MRIVFAITAAAAFLVATTARAEITTSYYSVDGSASGSFTLDFDNATSVYSLTALDLTMGQSFDKSGILINSFGSLLNMDGTGLGGIMVPGMNQFYFTLDPTAASQSVSMNIGVVGTSGPGSSSGTVDQTGSSGSLTDYLVSSASAWGSFSLDFNNVSSVYSLTTLDMFVGHVFDEGGVQTNSFGSLLNIDGTGLGGIMVPGQNQFYFTLDPTAASQSVSMNIGVVGTNGPGHGQVTITQLSAPPSVPEPATWAMMLMGFGAVGFVARRRRAERVPI